MSAMKEDKLYAQAAEFAVNGIDARFPCLGDGSQGRQGPEGAPLCCRNCNHQVGNRGRRDSTRPTPTYTSGANI